MKHLRQYIRHQLIIEENSKYKPGSIGHELEKIRQHMFNKEYESDMKSTMSFVGKTVLGLSGPVGGMATLLWDLGWHAIDSAKDGKPIPEREISEYPILDAFDIDPDVWDVLDDHEVINEWMPEYFESLKGLDPTAPWSTIPDVNDFIAKKVAEVSGNKVQVVNIKELRQYVRKLLLTEMAQDIVPGAKVIFMAGAPGSGKSTVLSQLSFLSRFEVVNPDDWYEPFLEEAGIPLDIAGFTQRYFDLTRAIRHGEENGLDTTELEAWKAELKPMMSKNMKLFNKARRLAKERASQLSQEGKDFIIDGTGGNYREISKLKEAYEAMGYSTAMIYITIPMETSVERNFQRGEKGKRRLHQSAVERSWESVNTNREPYEQLFGDNFFYVDNSGTYEDYQDNIELIRDGIQEFLEG